MICRPRYGFAAFALLLSLLTTGVADAGGGPENVFLVYNSASTDSKEIADFYAGIRRIPKGNVFGIEWRGGLEIVSVEKFRRDLLTPLLKEINKRGLARQIDYVVYSADFPWKIDLSGDTKGVKVNRGTAPYASLTGATYLYQFVLAKSSAILGLNTNWYVPNRGRNLERCVDVADAPSRSFSSRRQWTIGAKAKNPKEEESSLQLRYMLSTMLACTRGRGNTVAEAKAYLKRAAYADSVTPEGTFYFYRHNGPRSKSRHACFQQVAESLKDLGAKVKVMEGRAPSNISDALGIVMGTPDYDLARSKVTLRPGAIGDNLTSYGGIMKLGTPQTPLSEMLRHGAVGASGTVHEPTALQSKFPLPTVMLHYRRGCSLAEAFYQSVASPYQLLIVGDPLCQPWAKPPKITVPGLRDGLVLSKPVIVRPRMKPGEPEPPKAWELYVDGRLRLRLPNKAALRLIPSQLGVGTHELRFVGIGGSSVEPRARWLTTVSVPKEAAVAAAPQESGEIDPEAAAPPARSEESPADD